MSIEYHLLCFDSPTTFLRTAVIRQSVYDFIAAVIVSLCLFLLLLLVKLK